MSSTNTSTTILGAVVIVLLGIIGYMGYTQFMSSKGQQDAAPAQTANSPSQEEQAVQFSLQRDQIALDGLDAGSYVTSPLTITGLADQSWYDENGTFPITLEDEDGSVIAEGSAQADTSGGDGASAPFSATLTFDKPTGTLGMLRFEKSVASSTPENGYSYSISVTFEPVDVPDEEDTVTSTEATSAATSTE